jgi:hypothetical protein
LKQLAGLEYTLCLSSLFNAAYVQGARWGCPGSYFTLEGSFLNKRKAEEGQKKYNKKEGEERRETRNSTILVYFTSTQDVLLVALCLKDNK